MLLSKCAVCNSKNSRFTSEQEVSGLLRQLGIRTPLLGSIFIFLRYSLLIYVWVFQENDLEQTPQIS